MSNRWGLSLIVLMTTGFMSSDFGIAGNGEAVSDQSAEEREKCSLLSHKLHLRYLGRNSCAGTFFDIARFLPMTHSFTSFAGMLEMTIVG